MDPLDYAGNVHHWAGRYLRVARVRGLDRDDLSQIGYMAVLKAGRCPALSIRRDMGRAIDAPAAVASAMAVSISDDLDGDFPDCRSDDGEDAAAAMLARLTDRQALALELHLGLDGTPGRSIGEVARMMGLCSEGNAGRLIKAGLAILKSGEPCPTARRRTGRSTGGRPGPRTRLDRLDRDERERLLEAIDSLPEAWRRVVRERHLTTPPRLLKDIAADLGITANCACQIERKALDRLKAGLVP